MKIIFGKDRINELENELRETKSLCEKLKADHTMLTEMLTHDQKLAIKLGSEVERYKKMYLDEVNKRLELAERLRQLEAQTEMEDK